MFYFCSCFGIYFSCISHFIAHLQFSMSSLLPKSFCPLGATAFRAIIAFRLLSVCAVLSLNIQQTSAAMLPNDIQTHDPTMIWWQWQNISHILLRLCLHLFVCVSRTLRASLRARPSPTTMIETKIYCFHVYSLYCHEHCSFDAFPLHFVAQNWCHSNAVDGHFGWQAFTSLYSNAMERESLLERAAMRASQCVRQTKG